MASRGKKLDNEGVYGKFLDFLRSPMWALPVLGFIEQRSIVFEDSGDQKVYKEIHREYRAMVDMLIQCFCEDVGVKPEDLTTSLKADTTSRSELELNMLEPVIAAQDFEVFVHMMMRKNVELQLQALQMIEIMCGMIPAVLMPGGDGEKKGKKGKGMEEDQERIILIQVMKDSKVEFEKSKKKKDMEPEVEEAMKASLEEKSRLEAERAREEELIQQAMRLSLEERGAQSARAPSAGKKNSLTSSTPASGKSAAEIRAMMKNKNETASAEELQKRQEYLRQQRDKLLNRKREARMKAFSEAEGDAKNSRPKTASAAKSAMSGRKGAPVPKVSDEVLEARKALAAKLKAEVVGM